MRRTFKRGRVIVVAAMGALGLLALVRCADVSRGLGAACIRNEDCLSGACSGQVCVAQPTLFDADTAFDAGVDSGSTADAGVDAPKTTHDTGAPPPKKDSGQPKGDAAKDGTASHDAGDAAHDGSGNEPDVAVDDSGTPDAAKDAMKSTDAKVDDAATDGHRDSG